MVNKSPEAFRTISEVADVLDVPPHVLRFWESRFTQVKPVKRGGGRRYYRPDDVCLLRGIRGLLYDDGMTIKGVQKILREKGVRHVVRLGSPAQEEVASVDAACEDEVESRTLRRAASGDRPNGPWDRFTVVGAKEPQLVVGFGEAKQARIAVSDKKELNGAVGASGTEKARSGEDGNAPGKPEVSETDPAVAEADVAETTPVEDASAEAAPRDDEPRDRKAALKKLVAELQALRERMAEGLTD